MMHEWKVTQQRYGRLLRQRMRRRRRRREKILADLVKARGWEELRRKGELLRVHHQRIGRGLAEVTLPHYYPHQTGPPPAGRAPPPPGCPPRTPPPGRPAPHDCPRPGPLG